MKNVIVYDRSTNEERGEFLTLPDNEQELKQVLQDKLGHGSYRLRWKDYKNANGKRVGFPRQRIVRCLPPLELQRPGRARDYQDERETHQAMPVAPVAGMASGGESSFLVQLILQRIDQNFAEILRRIDHVTDILESEGGDDQNFEGMPETPTDFQGVIQSIMVDPQYSGLVGSVLANASNPDQLGAAIKKEMDENPGLISGLFGKFMPLLMQGGNQ